MQTVHFKNCSHVCAYHRAQTVLYIVPLIFQIIIVAQTLSSGEDNILWKKVLQYR